MTNGRWYLTATLALVASGAALIGLNFDVMKPLFYVGLTLIVTAGISASCGVHVKHARSMDEEFDAGYRVGYKAGRRVPELRPMSGKGRRAPGREVKSGRVSQAPLRVVAGDDSPPRWAASDAN